MSNAVAVQLNLQRIGFVICYQILTGGCSNWTQCVGHRRINYVTIWQICNIVSTNSTNYSNRRSLLQIYCCVTLKNKLNYVLIQCRVKARLSINIMRYTVSENESIHKQEFHQHDMKMANFGKLNEIVMYLMTWTSKAMNVCI